MQGRNDDARTELDKSNARTACVQHELDDIREATQVELVQLKAALAIATSQAAVASAQAKAARKEKARAQHALLEARDMASVLRGRSIRSRSKTPTCSMRSSQRLRDCMHHGFRKSGTSQKIGGDSLSRHVDSCPVPSAHNRALEGENGGFCVSV
jgi:hypothetical protein